MLINLYKSPMVLLEIPILLALTALVLSNSFSMVGPYIFHRDTIQVELAQQVVVPAQKMGRCLVVTQVIRRVSTCHPEISYGILSLAIFNGKTLKKSSSKSCIALGLMLFFRSSCFYQLVMKQIQLLKIQLLIPIIFLLSQTTNMRQTTSVPVPFGFKWGKSLQSGAPDCYK